MFQLPRALAASHYNVLLITKQDYIIIIMNLQLAVHSKNRFCGGEKGKYIFMHVNLFKWIGGDVE